MGFNCTGCGLCCHQIKRMVESAKEAVSKGSKHPLAIESANFPFSWDESGACENLLSDNKCKVYDHRPDICNVDTMYKKYYSKQMPQAEFYSINERGCGVLKKEFENQGK